MTKLKKDLKKFRSGWIKNSTIDYNKEIAEAYPTLPEIHKERIEAVKRVEFLDEKIDCLCDEIDANTL